MNYPFQYSDAGRSKSKRPRQKNDCTVRALALATGVDYDVAYTYLAVQGRKCSSGYNLTSLLTWFAQHEYSLWGCKFDYISFPAVKGQKRMNIVSFLEEFQEGAYIIKTAKHVACVKDGVLFDTVPEREDRCVYCAWKVEKS